MKEQFMLQLSVELQHFMESLTTFCYPCNCNAAKFGSCRIWNYLMIAGVNQKGLLLLWSEMWK